MAEEYKVHIRTTGDPAGAEITQDALEETAQAGEKIVDAVTKGDRATANFVAKLKQLSPEQLDRVEREFHQLIAAEEEAGRDAAALRAQLQQLNNVSLDKVKRETSGIFGGVTAGTLAANAIGTATNALRTHLRTSVELADQLDDLAGRAGVTAEALQIIGNTASRNNGSIQGTADALSKVQISAQDAIAGNKPLLESFERLGITTKDLKSLSPDQLFYKISEAVTTSSDRGRTYTDVIDVMGRSSKDLFTTLELGPERIQALGRSIGVFNKETTKSLAEANDALEKLQNNLTIYAGNAISFLTNLGEDYENLFRSQEQIDALAAADKRVADAAEAARNKSKQAAGAFDEMGTAAGSAAVDLQHLATIEQHFAGRALAKLPVTEQLVELRQEIDRVRTEAEKRLPGLKFADSNALFELSKTAGLTKEARQQVIALAVDYARLEDKLKQASDSDQKLQPDRLKRIEEIRVELAKPNIPLDVRVKLLQEELRLMHEIRAAAEARAKTDAAAAARPAPKPLSDPAALARDLDALEARSRGAPDVDALERRVATRSRLQRPLAPYAETDAVVQSAGEIGTAVAEGLVKIKGAIDGSVAQIKPAFDPSAEAIAKDIPLAIQEGNQKLIDGVAKGVGEIRAAYQRDYNKIWEQIAALWRAS